MYGGAEGVDWQCHTAERGREVRELREAVLHLEDGALVAARAPKPRQAQCQWIYISED